jgi:hypothetical protein
MERPMFKCRWRCAKNGSENGSYTAQFTTIITTKRVDILAQNGRIRTAEAQFTHYTHALGHK